VLQLKALYLAVWLTLRRVKLRSWRTNASHRTACSS